MIQIQKGYTFYTTSIIFQFCNIFLLFLLNLILIFQNNVNTFKLVERLLFYQLQPSNVKVWSILEHYMLRKYDYNHFFSSRKLLLNYNNKKIWQKKMNIIWLWLHKVYTFIVSCFYFGNLILDLCYSVVVVWLWHICKYWHIYTELITSVAKNRSLSVTWPACLLGA